MTRIKGQGLTLYGVFFGTQWCLGWNGRKAKTFARINHGTVYALKHANGYGAPSSWDAPTFRVTADLVADYRTTEVQ